MFGLRSDDCDGSVLLLVCCIVRRSPLMPPYCIYLLVDDVKEMGLLTIQGHNSSTQSPGSVKTNPSRKRIFFVTFDIQECVVFSVVCPPPPGKSSTQN